MVFPPALPTLAHFRRKPRAISLFCTMGGCAALLHFVHSLSRLNCSNYSHYCRSIPAIAAIPSNPPLFSGQICGHSDVGNSNNTFFRRCHHLLRQCTTVGGPHLMVTACVAVGNSSPVLITSFASTSFRNNRRHSCLSCSYKAEAEGGCAT